MSDYKCYNTQSETKGKIGNEYHSFACESEYREMYEEYEKENKDK